MSHQVKLGRSPQILFRNVGPDVLLAVPGRHDFEQLGGSGALLWDMLAEPRTVNEVVELLAVAYGEDPSVVRPGVEAVVEQLVHLGVLEVAAGP
jgi:hypothetical protein